ncbi:ribonuclease HII [Candidatus Bandiella euplotis]|uniref:Ribonuclease HII n=1 Tax=Candidatus Bandiella euplotis TaxID=1664265 RepID=A0ABZ0ULW3_9RICK|nr:ribonuclease HII [Candidatus Bandiella woodruffii]WPX97133.1 Ribonuclease HII [Candidatus Bandiella woodruffii]
MMKPNLFYEKKLGGIALGVDEVGRGCVAGAVVAAGVILNDQVDVTEINDSKKLSANKREKIYSQLINQCIYATAYCSVEEIEKLNILQASLLAMRRVIAKIQQQHQFDHVLVDGNISPDIAMNNITTIIGGDGKSLSIAAASIVAKVTRDKMMEQLDKEFPQYQWKQNKGYCTAQHSRAIREHGICVHHRRSFLKNIIPQ